jgi:hypothetical protein
VRTVDLLLPRPPDAWPFRPEHQARHGKEGAARQHLGRQGALALRCAVALAGTAEDANLLVRRQAVADIIRTTLGPRSMLKMLLDASGGARLLRPPSACMSVTEV